MKARSFEKIGQLDNFILYSFQFYLKIVSILFFDKIHFGQR